MGTFNSPLEKAVESIGEEITDAIDPISEQKYRAAVLTELSRIAKILQVILNHQRVITGIESDNEGDF